MSHLAVFVFGCLCTFGLIWLKERGQNYIAIGAGCCLYAVMLFGGTASDWRVILANSASLAFLVFVPIAIVINMEKIEVLAPSPKVITILIGGIVTQVFHYVGSLVVLILGAPGAA